MAGSEELQAGTSPGMSMDEARALLHEVHKVGISEDDPILMLVTIHSAFLRDLEDQLRRHNVASASTIGEALEAMRKTLDQETQKFAALASGQTAKELRAVNDSLKTARITVLVCTVCMLAVGAALIFVAVGVR